MSDLVLYSTSGGVAILSVNNPPVNALSPGVPEGILEGLTAAAQDDSIAAVVLIGGGTAASGVDAPSGLTRATAPARIDGS